MHRHKRLPLLLQFSFLCLLYYYLLEDAGLCESRCWRPSSYGNCPRLQKGGTAAKQDWIWSAARALLITPSILVDLAKRASLMTPEGVSNPPPWQMSKSLVNNRTRVKRNKWPFRIGREVENVWRLTRRGSWALIGAGNRGRQVHIFLVREDVASMSRWKWAVRLRSVQSLNDFYVTVHLSDAIILYTYVHILYNENSDGAHNIMQ